MDNKCRKANKLINGYIDGELNEKDRMYFKAHIKECTHCRNSYETLKLLISDISDTGMKLPPADFSAKLHMRLAEEAQGKQKKAFVIRPYINIAVSAALICAVAFGTNVYKNYSEQMQKDLLGNKQTTVPEQVKTGVADSAETKEISLADVSTTETDSEIVKEPLTKQAPKQASVAVDSGSETPPIEAIQEAAVITETTEKQADLTAPALATEDIIDETEAYSYAADSETETEADNELTTAAHTPISSASSGGSASSISSVSGGGGGSSSAVFNNRKTVFYAEYTVDLTTKPELIEQLKSSFNVTSDNILICDDEEFNRLVDFLNNNDLFLNFISERNNNNIVKFKL